MFFFWEGEGIWAVLGGCFLCVFPCNCITVTFECLLVRCSSLTIIILNICNPSVIC